MVDHNLTPVIGLCTSSDPDSLRSGKCTSQISEGLGQIPNFLRFFRAFVQAPNLTGRAFIVECSTDADDLTTQVQDQTSAAEGFGVHVVLVEMLKSRGEAVFQ